VKNLKIKESDDNNIYMFAK